MGRRNRIHRWRSRALHLKRGEVAKNPKCEHNKWRSCCRICSPHKYCKHDIYRGDYCRVCSPQNFCEHDIYRGNCRVRECNPTKFCEHDLFIGNCRVCSPQNFCDHGIWRGSCSRCEPLRAYGRLKNNAKGRDYECDLTFEEYKFLVSLPCRKCGESIKPMGIDRINNLSGYALSNCQPYCAHCNYMKADFTQEEFDDQLHKIWRHQETISKGKT